MPHTETLDELTWQELRSILDEEIGRLPAKYQAVVVLCHLECKSYDQAARELGCPKSTLARRLTKALELLRGQLTRRGIALSAGALATALAEKATAAPVPALLSINIIKAAACVAAGANVAGILSTQAIALAEDAMKTMIGIKAKLAMLVLAFGLAVGAAFAGYDVWLGKAPPPRVDEKQPPLVQEESVKKDAHGDALPAGAVARLGQDRWQNNIMARFSAFLPDGKTVVTVNVDRTIRVWEFPSGKEIRRIALPTQDLSSASNLSGSTTALAKDGKTIATWRPEEPSAICLHDLDTGKQLPGLELPEVAKERGFGGVRSTDVSALAFSPDGKHLAGAARNGEVRIWDWAKAKEVRSFAAGKPIERKKDSPLDFLNKMPSWGIAYAPDGKSLATFTSADGAVKIWNPDTAVEIRTIRSEGITSVITLAVSPDGKTLALAAYTGEDLFPGGPARKASIVLVETATGKEIARLNMPEPFQLGGVVFGKDGAKLYVSAYGGLLTEWDVASRKLLRECKPWPNLTAITTGGAIAMSPDGKTLVGIGTGPPFRDLTGKDITAFESRNAPLISVQFTPDGKNILTVSHELLTREFYPFPAAQSVRRWDAATGKDLGKVNIPPFSGPTVISLDGKFVAAAFPREYANVGPERITVETKAAIIILVDPATGAEMGKIPGDANFMRFSPDGKILAVRAGKIKLYGVPDAKLRHTVEFAPAKGVKQGSGGRMFHTMLFSPDGKVLAARADSRTLGLWDTTTGQRIGSVPLPQDSKLRAAEGSQFMESAAFSPDGRCLILDSHDGTALLYELATGKPLRTFGTKVALKEVPKFQMGGVNYLLPDEFKAGSCFAFSLDGKLLARGGFDRIVRLWDVATGCELAAFKGHDGAVTALAFSPDGESLASASADTTALLWDLTRVERPKAQK